MISPIKCSPGRIFINDVEIPDCTIVSGAGLVPPKTARQIKHEKRKRYRANKRRLRYSHRMYALLTVLRTNISKDEAISHLARMIGDPHDRT